MTPSLLDTDQYLAHFDADCRTLLEVARTGDQNRPIAGCPDWTLRDLAMHVGTTYRWANLRLSNAPAQESSRPPADIDALAWLSDNASVLTQQLHTISPDTVCRTFDGERRADFWIRRMAQETAVHRWDAQQSQGDPAPIPADLAADGIDEITTMFYPRQVKLQRIEPLPHTLAIEPVDIDRRFVLGGSSEPTATLHGPAEALLLLLWNRIDLAEPRIRVSGAESVVTEALAAAIVP